MTTRTRRKIAKLFLCLAAAAAGAACTTDVSSVASLGTQGRLLGGVPIYGNTLDLPHAIAAGATGVYYATYQYIGYCDLQAGCLQQPDEYYDAVTLGQTALVVADGQNVYWTEFATVPPHMWLRSAPQEIYASNATTLYDGFNETVESHVDNLLSLGFLALDGTTLYWTTNPGPAMPTATKLSWCPTTGCTNPPSIMLLPYWTVLAVKDATIYLGKPEASGTALAACDTSMSCTDIVGSPYVVSTLAPASIDGGNLYFVAQDAQSRYGLYACALPKCGGGPKLVFGMLTPYQEVVSEGVVYAGVVGKTPGFGTCRVGSCSAGPQRIDLPFDPPIEFTELGSPSVIVAAPMGGAYGYAALLPSSGSHGLSLANDPVGLVYLPPPSQ